MVIIMFITIVLHHAHKSFDNLWSSPYQIAANKWEIILLKNLLNKFVVITIKLVRLGS